MDPNIPGQRPGETRASTRDRGALSTGSQPRVTAVFPDRESAERAFRFAQDRGYTNDEIDVVMSDDTRKRHYSDTTQRTELGNKAAEGAGVGGAVGGTLGALVAGIAALGTSVAVPGLGLVVAGPLAAALAGAGVGGAAGSLTGALIGAGISETRVKDYEAGIRKGGIFLGVSPRSEADAEALRREWREDNARDLNG